MLSIKVETIVNDLVEQLLIKAGGNEKVLHFGFKCNLAYYEHVNSGGPIYDSVCGLHLLYHLQPGYGYVDVFSAITDSASVTVKQVNDWKHEASHGSCWRDIGTFSKVYFDLADKVNVKLVEDGRSAVAPMHMSEHNGPQLFGPVFSWVDAKVSIDPNCDRRYRKLVSLL